VRYPGWGGGSDPAAPSAFSRPPAALQRAPSGRVAVLDPLRSNGAMSQQPQDPAPTADSPAGIDQPLDKGVEQSVVEDDPDTDLQSSTDERTDPDDPEAAIEQATERSRGGE
jgi:hypothetical protein